MTEIEPRHLESLATYRQPVGEPISFLDLGYRPAVHVWPYRQDGLFEGGLWCGPIETIHADVRPVTEPAVRVDAARRAMRWLPGRPVYAVMEPRLQIWTQDDQWFVDDSVLPLGGRRHISFVWWFGAFEEAAEAIVRFYRERLGPVCSA